MERRSLRRVRACNTLRLEKYGDNKEDSPEQQTQSEPLPTKVSTHIVEPPRIDHQHLRFDEILSETELSRLLTHPSLSMSTFGLSIPYVHNRLDTSKQEIRLFRLRPPMPPQEEVIQGNLQTFDIEQCPKFYCVSYTWGPPKPGRTILVDGHGLYVRENLWNFLHAFQIIGDHNSFIWIDQICIDQSTVSERNHQVQMMSTIYQRATEVIAWLGNNDTSEIALKEIRRYSKQRFQGELDSLRVSRSVTPRSVTPQEPSSYHKTQIVIEGLVLADLWGRIWVHQEIILAPKIAVMCRHSLVPWHWILAYRKFFERQVLWENLSAGKEFKELIDLRNTDFAGRHLTLLDALERFSGGECSDKRDRVFGLLGLVRVEQRIDVDYSKTMGEVAIAVFLRLVQVDNDLPRNATSICSVVFLLDDKIPWSKAGLWAWGESCREQDSVSRVSAVERAMSVANRARIYERERIAEEERFHKLAVHMAARPSVLMRVDDAAQPYLKAYFESPRQ